MSRDSHLAAATLQLISQRSAPTAAATAPAGDIVADGADMTVGMQAHQLQATLTLMAPDACACSACCASSAACKSRYSTSLLYRPGLRAGPAGNRFADAILGSDVRLRAAQSALSAGGVCNPYPTLANPQALNSKLVARKPGRKQKSYLGLGGVYHVGYLYQAMQARDFHALPAA